MKDYTELLENADIVGRQTQSTIVEDLTKAIRELQAQNKDLIQRNAFLRERPDLPVDRIPAYKRMQEQVKDL